MTRGITQELTGEPGDRPAHHIGGDDRALTGLTSVLFASLARSDQRRRGTDYLRGLLGVSGRRSIRNIAAMLGGQATEQSLHHFICSSTWDWVPVRRALARYLVERVRPAAWVTRPMVIPKVGENSVGVDRQYVPEIGQILNAQHAVGVWAATEETSVPVNWRLQLSASWLENRTRRRQAAIPDHLTVRTVGECTVEAALETAAGWGLPLRPVVLDARQMDAAATVRRFRGAGVPFLARVGGDTALTVTDPALPHRTAEPLSAERIMATARDRARPVMWRDHTEDGAMRSGLATTVRVREPHAGRPGAAPGGLALLAIGGSRRQWPAELWLTDMTDAPLHTLIRLSRLTERIARDFRDTADRLGIRDFTGRTYHGWHRHVTLVSAAHALAVLRAAEPEWA
ncbi:IS701 family transposase [Streptomyces aidingensis]|uniref:SRSO17 transposase n=1 Tax=Streptomyces aidingensis TaxID=910347 RepID=A0A1I1FHV1_9ACTN|nr:transposase [Streptomyces aidingensis]SFB98536.1 SRSO17 transposase [Streptomyces aidingensis]